MNYIPTLIGSDFQCVKLPYLTADNKLVKILKEMYTAALTYQHTFLGAPTFPSSPFFCSCKTNDEQLLGSSEL